MGECWLPKGNRGAGQETRNIMLCLFVVLLRKIFCSLKILDADNPVDAGGDFGEVMPCMEEGVHRMRSLRKV